MVGSLCVCGVYLALTVQMSKFQYFIRVCKLQCARCKQFIYLFLQCSMIVHCECYQRFARLSTAIDQLFSISINRTVALVCANWLPHDRE